MYVTLQFKNLFGQNISAFNNNADIIKQSKCPLCVHQEKEKILWSS